MAVSLRMERLLDRVTLSKGRGDSRAERLCIMTLVALLAGERQTDSPRCASPFIRHYAVRLNDFLPDDRRQQLKLFASRIVGSNDGSDNVRIELARSTYENEVIPHLDADLGHRWLPDRVRASILAFAKRPFGSSPGRSAWATGWAKVGAVFEETDIIAREAADLLIHCAAAAPAHVDADWYWSKSVELLDRLCETGQTHDDSLITDEHIARAEAKLARAAQPGSGLDRLLAWGSRLVGREPTMVIERRSDQHFTVTSAPMRSGEWDEVWTIGPESTASPEPWVIDRHAAQSETTGGAKPTAT